MACKAYRRGGAPDLPWPISRVPTVHSGNIHVHVSELKQLFNAIDPSPFTERDLDPGAEEFIADWAKEASPSATLGLALYLDRRAGLPDEPAELRVALGSQGSAVNRTVVASIQSDDSRFTFRPVRSASVNKYRAALRSVRIAMLQSPARRRLGVMD